MRKLSVFLVVLITVSGCSQDDSVDPKTYLIGEWELVSAKIDCYENDKYTESYTRTANASFVEFRDDYTYIATDLEDVQYFSIQGNPLYSSNFLEGGMWKPIYDFKYLHLDLGVSEPIIILKINNLTSEEFEFQYEIKQSNFPEDSTGYRFALIAGYLDGINIFSSYDTSVYTGFDLGYLCGKGLGFYSSDPTDVSANYGYWRGFFIGFRDFNLNKDPDFTSEFSDGLQAGQIAGKSYGESLGEARKIERRYELHYTFKKKGG